MVRRALLASLALIAAAKAGPAEPDVLSPADERRYRDIFLLQEAGKLTEADPLIKAIEDPVLLGYVFEQRYMHPTAYRSSYTELARWLSSYADHPDAAQVYKLAQRRRPQGARPQRPVARRWRTSSGIELHPDLEADYRSQGASHGREVARIESRVRYLLGEDRPSQALNYLNDPRQFNMLTSRQTDRIRGWIAESFYLNGKLADADRLGRQAADRSRGSAVIAQWTVGLVAWRRNDMQTAYRYHSAMADEPHQESSLRAAAAYWASRAAIAMGRGEEALLYLDIAAAHPLTFYGQLALGQLGRASGIDWSPIELTDAQLDRLLDESPRLTRAIALAEVGMHDEASMEIRYAQGELGSEDDGALLALAGLIETPSAEVRIAEGLGIRERTDRSLWPALYPVPEGLTPNNGFLIDRAVLFGLIRQESKFSANAVSSVGAAGLMQVMPRTASYITGDQRLMQRGSRASRRLFDSGYNMQLGQSYVERLLREYNDGRGDMFETALSYNWGPGNYRRWSSRAGIEDQLLMLESVPNKEARNFVDHVMTNIWVYRDRMNEPAPDRDAAAAGLRPVYQSVK